MIFALLLAMTQQPDPVWRCRLDTGREVPCGDSVAAARRQPRALAQAAVIWGHDYDPNARSLTLACYRLSGGTCHFRIAEGQSQRLAHVTVGRAVVVRKVGWNARLCADRRVQSAPCRGDPVTTRAPASARRV